MEDAKPRNDANLGTETKSEEIAPGEEFEGSRPGKKTAALVALVVGAYVVIDHWTQIAEMFS